MSSIEIQHILNGFERIVIADTVLRNIPEYIENYDLLVSAVENVNSFPMLAAIEQEEVVGFISYKPKNQFAVQIVVVGIIDVYNQKEVFKRLIQEIEVILIERGFKLLTYYGLKSSRNYRHYIKSRELFRSMNFYPLDESPDHSTGIIPDEIMVRPIFGT